MFFKKRKDPTPAETASAAPPPEATPPAETVGAGDLAAGAGDPAADDGEFPKFTGDGVQGPMRDLIVGAMKRVYDPEIPVDVYELGLIYRVDVSADGAVAVDMTLTSPNCPSAEQIPGDIERRIREVEGVGDVRVDVVWDPPWDRDKMSEVAKLELGME